MVTPEEIGGVALFAALDLAQREQLSRVAADVSLVAGEYAAHEGAERALFAVLEGRIEPTRLVDGVERVLGERNPGDVFGEVPIALGTVFPMGFRAAEAARAWREICAVRAEHGNRIACAQAQRRLAAVHELRADRDAAFAARNAAAEAFAAEECLAEAAVERLAPANYLRAGANYSASIDLALTAATDAERAGRLDLRLRALGLQGLARAKGGDYEGGLATVREGLAQALEHDLTEVSADLYQRLSMVLYDAGDYPGANDMLDRAHALCPTGDEGTHVACMTCLVYVLRERG